MCIRDRYGNERSLGKKFSDVAKAGMGVIPGGIQLKKTYEGAKSVLEGGSYDKAGRKQFEQGESKACLLYTSPSPRDRTRSRMPSSA